MANWHPSPLLIDDSTSQLQKIRTTMKRSIERTLIDVFQLSLRHPDFLSGLITSSYEEVETRWERLCAEIGIPHKTFRELGLNRKRIETSINKRSKESANEAIEPVHLGVPARPNQSAFRDKVISAYGKECAITGLDSNLEAAHLVPVSRGGDYAVQNGILMHRDIHVHFDRFRIAISIDFVILVADKHRDRIRFHGQKLRLPKMHSHWPKIENVLFHNRSCRWLQETI